MSWWSRCGVFRIRIRTFFVLPSGLVWEWRLPPAWCSSSCSSSSSPPAAAPPADSPRLCFYWPAQTASPGPVWKHNTDSDAEFTYQEVCGSNPDAPWAIFIIYFPSDIIISSHYWCGSDSVYHQSEASVFWCSPTPRLPNSDLSVLNVVQTNSGSRAWNSTTVWFYLIVFIAVRPSSYWSVISSVFYFYY